MSEQFAIRKAINDVDKLNGMTDVQKHGRKQMLVNAMIPRAGSGEFVIRSAINKAGFREHYGEQVMAGTWDGAGFFTSNRGDLIYIAWVSADATEFAMWNGVDFQPRQALPAELQGDLDEARKYVLTILRLEGML